MPLRESRPRVGVLGAGAWAANAHVPGWLRDPRCELVAIADIELDRARALASEHGIAETIKVARPNAVECKELETPSRFYPVGGHPRESWRSMFYANLINDFVSEILDGSDRNQGNFDDGAAVQEVINAVELSYRERRWVDLPLEG